MTSNPELNRDMLRHIIASLAYRITKTLRDAPDVFADYCIDMKSRTPIEILSHICDLFDWAYLMLNGNGIWHNSHPTDWNSEVARILNSLKKFDDYLASNAQIACSLNKLFQGPIADAFTHVGQLAMLRKLSGSPVKGENYFAADIVIGSVGLEQSKPIIEFD